MALCEVCLDILRDRRDRQPLKDATNDSDTEALFIHHRTGPSLRFSSDAGCVVCRSFWIQLNQAEQARVEATKDVEMVTIMVLTPACGIDIQGVSMLAVHFDSDIDLSGLSNKKTPAFSIFVLQPYTTLRVHDVDTLHRLEVQDCLVSETLSTSTASPESWATAAQWLGTCVNDHPECSRPSGSAMWLPTRLLNIGAHLADLIYLVDGRDLGSGDTYVTLSHCWGRNPNFLQLTRQSRGRLRDGVSTESLPQTFRDAVGVARRLGIRYLWIDSLCIMQDRDDLTDWLHEAQLMDKVYSNSFCNISATGSTDTSSGLFFNRDVETLRHAVLNLSPNVIKQEGKLVPYTLIDFLRLRRDFELAPLHQRGWVAQERLLAPRVLHFAQSQLFWECRKGFAAECYPKGLPPALMRTTVATFKNLDPEHGKQLRANGGKPADDRFNAYELWDRIVGAYSHGLLTKPEDKLIALSGIAKVMAGVVDDVYVAGMWKRYLASSLLWWVSDGRQADDTPSRRPLEYRAPTFSWTSVDGQISTAEVSDDGLRVEILDVNIALATENPFGPVNRGALFLLGCLKPLKLRRFVVHGKPLSWTMEVCGQEVRPKDGEPWERLGPLVLLDVAQDDFEADNDQRLLYCLPVQGPTQHNEWLGVLLLKCMERSTGHYERFGIAKSKHKEEIDILLHSRDQGAGIPTASYDLEKHMRTIVLL